MILIAILVIALDSAVFGDSAMRNVVQLSGNTPQKPPVIRHCVTHHTAANDKVHWKVCDLIVDDRRLLSGSVQKLNDIPRTKPCQNHECWNSAARDSLDRGTAHGCMRSLMLMQSIFQHFRTIRGWEREQFQNEVIHVRTLANANDVESITSNFCKPIKFLCMDGSQFLETSQ